MMNKDDKYGIEVHGVDKWAFICGYVDAIEARKEALVRKAFTEMEKLFDYLRKLLGRPELTFKSEIKTKRDGSLYISFESDSIKSNDPVLNLLVKEIVVSDFGGSVAYERKSPYSPTFDLNKEVEMAYWLPMDFCYKHHGGGSNGTELATAHFTESGEWIFKAVNEGRE